MSKQVFIETDECIGCRLCVDLCPDIFGFDEDSDKAIILKQDEALEKGIDDAIEQCPVECIHWQE